LSLRRKCRRGQASSLCAGAPPPVPVSRGTFLKVISAIVRATQQPRAIIRPTKSRPNTARQDTSRARRGMFATLRRSQHLGLDPGGSLLRFFGCYVLLLCFRALFGFLEHVFEFPCSTTVRRPIQDFGVCKNTNTGRTPDSGRSKRLTMRLELY
jgi:hypothetical protein